MQKTEEKSVYMDGLDEGISTLVKNSSEKALNTVLRFIHDEYGKASVATGNAFNLYLKNSELRYNKVKTLADMTEPRTLEGKDGIYVDVYLDYKEIKLYFCSVYISVIVHNHHFYSTKVHVGHHLSYSYWFTPHFYSPSLSLFITLDIYRCNL